MKHFYYLAAIPLLFTGCINRDVEVNPDVSVPDAFANAQLAGGADVDEAAWWASFGDPQLSALVQKALENNRSLKAAEAGIGDARAARKGAIAQLFPSFGLVGEEVNNLSLVNPEGRTQGYLYGVGAQWELDIFGMQRNKARAQAQLMYAAQEKYRGARLLVASETAKAYLTWRNVAARTVVLRKAIALQRRSLEVVEGRLPEGFSSTFDVDRAKAKLAAAEALLPKLETADVKLRGALAVLTGQPASSFTLDAGADWSAIAVPTPPSALPSTVLLRRPDVQAAKRTVEAQMYAVGAAKSAYFPQFSFNMLAANEFLKFSPFLYAYTSSGVINKDLDGQVTDTSLSATLPIFTFGRIRAAVKGQEARLDAVSSLYENTILQAVSDVEVSYYAFASTQRRSDSLKQSADSASSAADKVQGLYEGGLADLTDVLATQTAAQEQADAYLQGSLEHTVSAIDLYDALGGFAEEKKQ